MNPQDTLAVPRPASLFPELPVPIPVSLRAEGERGDGKENHRLRRLLVRERSRDGKGVVLFLLAPEEIIWVRANGGHRPLHLGTVHREFRAINLRSLGDFREALRQISPELPDRKFFQINRANLVNLEFARRVLSPPQQKASGVIFLRSPRAPGGELPLPLAVRRWGDLQRFLAGEAGINREAPLHAGNGTAP